MGVMTITLVAITDQIPNKPIGAAIPENVRDTASGAVGTKNISNPEPVPSKPVLTPNSEGPGDWGRYLSFHP